MSNSTRVPPRGRGSGIRADHPVSRSWQATSPPDIPLRGAGPATGLGRAGHPPTGRPGRRFLHRFRLLAERLTLRLLAGNEATEPDGWEVTPTGWGGRLYRDPRFGVPAAAPTVADGVNACPRCLSPRPHWTSCPADTDATIRWSRPGQGANVS